jgi:hypothetical protein
MDYLLQDLNFWAGVQIPIASGSANTDLSGYNSVSFDCKSEGDLSGVDFYIEIGAVSEDLDGDGILDAETGTYSSGYTFNDPNTPYGTLIGGDSTGGGNNSADTEDINGNGFLDPDKTDAFAIFSTNASDFTIPGSSWNRIRLYFTETGPAARAKLKDAEFIRITAVNTAGGQQSGRVLVDDIRFEGSSLFDDSSAAEPDFSEIKETLISSTEAPVSTLGYPYKTATDENNAMRVSWSAPWKLYSVLSPLNCSDYGSIVFYIHSPELTSPLENTSTLIFRMIDTGGKGITASLPFSRTSAWQKIEIKTSSGEIFIDDTLSTTAQLTIDPAAAGLTKLELEVADSSAGVLFIDEIHLINPALNTTAGASADFSISTEKSLLKAGELEIIGPSSFKTNISFTTALDDTPISNLDLFTGLKTKIMGADTSAELSWGNITGASLLSASHSLNIPLISSYLSVTDTFRTENTGGGNFSKSSNINISAGPVSGRLAGFSATYNTGLLTQKWETSLETSAAPFSISLGAEMLLSGTGYTPGWNNYFSGWAEGMVLTGVFSNSILKERKTIFTLSPALSTLPAGVKADLSFTAGVSESKSFDSAKLSLGLPLSFKVDSSSITAEIGYSREAEYYSQSSSENFIDDITGFFTIIAGREYLYASIPALELFTADLTGIFSADCAASGINEALLENSLYANLSRQYSSYLTDLFIPYSLDVKFSRKLVQDFADTEDGYNLTLGCRTAVMNLFGTAGVYPTFDFYFSDEINWSVDAVISKLTDSTPVQEYFIKGGFSVFGFEDQALSFDNDFYLPVNKTDSDWTLISSLLYIWNASPETPIDLPFFTDEEEALQIFTNQEKLKFNFADTFNTELKHITSLIIPQTLTITAFGSVGFQINTLSENQMYLWGISAGISASILY